MDDNTLTLTPPCPPCPACGNPLDYCLGHGVLGDPVGWARLNAHDKGLHGDCHPAADCSE